MFLTDWLASLFNQVRRCGRADAQLRQSRCRRQSMRRKRSAVQHILVSARGELLEERTLLSGVNLVDLPHNSSHISSALLQWVSPETEDDSFMQDYFIFDASGDVGVRITATDVEALLPSLVNIGFVAMHALPETHLVEGFLPLAAFTQVETLVADGLLGVLPIYRPLTSVGAATSQADLVQEADRVRNSLPTGYDGTGMTIGVLSDSYDTSTTAITHVAADIASGDLPAGGVNLLQEGPAGQTDEGRAMLQLIHDLTPGASLAFASAFFGEANFAQQIRDLADPGIGNADIIVDDVVYFAEPFFQDGLIAQAVDDVALNDGVAYFSSAGNQASNAWESTSISVSTDSGGFAGNFIDFDTGGGVDVRQLITLNNGQTFLASLQWDDPFYTTTGVNTDLDIFLVNASTTTIVASSVDDNLATQSPVEIIGFQNTSGSTQQYELLIQRFAGPSPGRVKYVNFGSGSISQFATNSPTLSPHAAATNGAGVAAVPYYDQTVAEPFTSRGLSTILFAPDGTLLPTADVRQTPRFAAIDGTDTTFFGSPDFDGTGFRNFFGTSAAAPHAAAIAALVKQANPSFTPAQIYTRLASTALDIGAAGFDNITGAGLINAYDAVFGAAVPVNPNYVDGLETNVLGGAWETHSNGEGRIRVSTTNGPRTGTHHLTMDTFFGANTSLNEAILHVDATNMSNVVLNFAEKESNDTDNAMPASFSGSGNYDGVAFSVNGTNWFRLVSLTAANSSSSWKTFSIDLSAAAVAAGVTLGSDVRIKFQQYGTFPFPGAGIAFDDISVTGTSNSAVLVSITTITDGAETGTPTNGKFRVTQSAVTATDTIVNYEISGTATPGAGNDYDTLTGTVTIPAGSTTADIDVTVLNDAIVELTETVIATLTSVSGDPALAIAPNTPNFFNFLGAFAPSTWTFSATAAGGSVNTAAAPASISLTSGNISTSGGGNADYTHPITTDGTMSFSWSYSTNDGAFWDSPFYLINGVATLMPGFDTAGADNQAGTAQIAVHAGDTFGFRMRTEDGIGGAATTVFSNFTVTATAIMNITDDDTATVSVAKGIDGTESNTPLNGFFVVTQSAVSSTDTVVTYSIGGTATPGIGNDYTTLSGTVTIPAGFTIALIPVNVQNDAIVEATESVIVTLTGFGAHDADITLDPIAANRTATVDIIDSDTATVSIARILDGAETSTPTNGQFRVTQTAVSSTNTILNYTITGTATPGAGNDYTTLTGTVTIPAGQTTADIDVLVLNDALVEGTETVIVTLTGIVSSDVDITLNPTPANLTATVNITDSDAATVSIAKILDGAETNTPTNGLFRVTQTAQSSTATIVSYSVSGIATPGAGNDYTTLTGTVTIPAGLTTADIDVSVLNDALVEGTETVIVTLTGFVSGDADITLDASAANRTATVNITDNDTATVSIAKILDGSETDTPMDGLFRVTQSAISSTDTIVNYTVSGTATPGVGNDYTTLTGTVTILAGNTTADITVAVLNDVIVEITETVNVTLTSLGAHDPDVALDAVPANLTATVNIVDYDQPTISIVAIADGAELNTPTNGLFRILLSGNVPSDTEINYSIAGTATPGVGNDYAQLSGTATILAGQTFVDIDVIVLNDTSVENVENVVVTITSLGAHDPSVILDPVPANLTATVSISDDDTAPIISANTANFAENTPNTTVVLDVNVNTTDVSGVNLSYSLSGPDSGLFNINSTTGEITFVASPDYEVPVDQGNNNAYDISVTVTADTVPPRSTLQALTIFVTPVNDNSPVIVSQASTSVPENTSTATVVLDVNAIDADLPAQGLNYSLSGPDAAAFNISSTGQITFAASPDFDAPLDQGGNNVYDVTVIVTDDVAPNLMTSQALTITVTALNDEAPIFITPSTATFAENTSVATVVLDVNATDSDLPGQSLSYTMSGPDVALFSINSVTGEIRFLSSPNYEAPMDQGANNNYDITVTATDNGSPALFTSQDITVMVTPVNDNIPVITSGATANFAENSSIAVVALDVNATDADLPAQSLAYSLSGPDAALFSINSGNGQITFLVSPNFEAPLDQGNDNVYNVTVTVSDDVATILSTSQSLAITVINVNEAPTDLNLSATAVTENQPVGTVIGTFSSNDVDAGDTFSYSFVAGAGSTDNARFLIAGGQLRTAASFDFETKSSYSIRVRTTDAGGLPYEKVLTITILDANDTPTNIALSANTVLENQLAGTPVGILTSTDQDIADTFTYSLVSGAGGADNGNFIIVGDQLQTATSLNFEAKPSHSIRVRTTDAGGKFFDKVFVVNVLNVNEQPTDISLSRPTVAENQVPGADVGSLITTDQDFGDIFSYQLVTGVGSDDNARFMLVGGQLQTTETFDFETRSSYSIRVRTTDLGGLSIEKVLTVGITNVNEKPTAFALSANSVPEDQPPGAAVGTFSTTDIDFGDTFTYSLVLGTGSVDNDSFAIVGDQLQTAATFDFESKSTYSIRVRSKDAGGLFIFSIFTINVTNVNDAPVDISVSPDTITENQIPGTTVGTFSTTDADIGETFTYALVTGAGSVNNSSFAIVGGQLQTAVSLDFEAQTMYSIRVRSTDSGGLTTEKALTINVANVNEQPTNVGLSGTVVAENQPAGITVGNLSSTDPDFGDTFTYALVSGPGSDDNASFTLAGGQLRTAASFDFEAQANYSVRIRTTDASGLFTEKVFTIDVTNVNEAPSNIAVSPSTVAENQLAGAVVGSLATTDQDAGDSFTYALVPGPGSADNASFVVSGGQIQTAASFNFETRSSYSVRVRSTDAGGLSTERILAISITNVNEAPVAIGLSNSTIDENQPIDTLVGMLNSTDPDAGDAFSYALVAGSGDEGNAAFMIMGDRLQAAQPLDFETQASYSIRVRSTDADGLSVEQVLTIQVEDVSDPPIVELSAGAVTLPNGKGGAIDPGSNAFDQDTTDFNNNRIVATIQPESRQPKDRLRLIPNGKGDTRLKAAKGSLKLGKVVVGAIIGGRDGEPLSITFTQSTAATMVQQVLRQIGFKTHASPGDTRRIEFQMFDSAGDSNPPVVKDVTID